MAAAHHGSIIARTVFRHVPFGLRDIYAGGSTHVASIRRDGFVSMDAGEETGELVTRPLTFKGRHLFVNLDAPNGELRVEALGPDGGVVEPFSIDRCIPVSGDEDLHPGPLARSRGPLGCRRYARHADAVPPYRSTRAGSSPRAARGRRSHGVRQLQQEVELTDEPGVVAGAAQELREQHARTGNGPPFHQAPWARTERPL